MNVAVCENGHYLGRQDLLDVSEKFCPACGAPILKECPNCGAPIRKNKNIVFTKYCTSCGELYPWWAEGKMKVEGEIISSTGEKYTQARPLLRDKIVDNICGLCDIVGQIVTSTKDGKRYIRLEGNNNVFAKDRVYKRKFCKFDELLINGKIQS